MRMGCFQTVRLSIFRRCGPVLVAGLAALAASPLWAQTFDPSVTVGAGVQTSYDHSKMDTGSPLDTFALDHARIYLSGTVTKDISLMFNTDYYGGTVNTLGIQDAVFEYDPSPKFNIWFGRMLPPSDRDDYTGPFYANEWLMYQDGVQDGYPGIFQGRLNGITYWGDFHTGIVKIKASAGLFDGGTAVPGNSRILSGGRIQFDFWDAEDGFFLNSTYYGDKNILAIGGATEVQTDKTATTVDFLLEKKIMNGGAFTVESEYSRYNRLGGYTGTSGTGEELSIYKSEGAYGLASVLFPKVIGIGKVEVLGKFADAEFTNGLGPKGTNPSYKQKTTEVDLGYIIKQFDARVFAFGQDVAYDGFHAPKDTWQAGLGLQIQMSKTIK